jgi:hypothetical protein
VVNPLDRDYLSGLGISPVVLDETGHLPHMERPGDINALFESTVLGR